MPLITRCTRCGHLFPVYAQELRERRGRASCPQCGNRLDALSALIDEPRGGNEANGARARLGVGSARHDGNPLKSSGYSSGSSRTQRPAPSVSRARPGGWATLGWTLIALILALLLAGQAAWWQRSDLLRDPQTRQWLDSACARLGCEVPAPRLPGTLALLEPTLNPNVEADGLTLSLRIKNQAPLAQPAPYLELELLDSQGELAAARRFTPDEYAPEAAPLLAPHATLAVQLALARPPMETSGFRVRLR